MPLASMLETDKPFTFASSHSNGSSTELTSTSTPTPINNNSNNNNSTLSRSPHTSNAKLSSSNTESSHYYSSSIPNEYESYNEETRQQQQLPPPPSSNNDNTLSSTSTNDTTNEALLESHTNHGQVNRINGYIYSPKKVTSYPSNSQLPSPATPTSTPSISNTTSIKPITTSLPPVSSTLASTSTSTPNIQRHTFNSTLSTQQLRHQDSSVSLPPPPIISTNSTNTHGIHSRQVYHSMEPHHNNIKMEESPLLKSSTHILNPTSSTANSTVTSQTKQSAAATVISTITTNQEEEGDPGYIDTNASDNRRVKRRKELNQRIENLNNDFLQNKERIFTEKLLMIQNEINQAHNFTHRKYKEGLLLLESIRKKAIDNSRLFLDYQTEITDKQFTLEIDQAEEEYLAEKHEVREKLFAVLEEKRRKLKEDKDNCDLSYDVVLETQTRMNKRSLRKRGMDNGDNKTNRRKQVNYHIFLSLTHTIFFLLKKLRPQLVFRLKEEEVYDDLQAMRSGLLVPPKKASNYKKK